MKEELLAFYRQIQQYQLKVHEFLQSIVGEIQTSKDADLVDSGFLCREIADICNDIRKAAELRMAIIGKFLAARATIAGMQGESMDLKGELASATPDVKTKPKLPDQGTPEFNRLMRWIGVSEELLAANMLRPSFTAIQEELTRRAALGEKPPPGISVTFTEASVVFRRRNSKKTNEQQEF